MRLENLLALPWYLRMIIFSAFALVVYLGFWYFVTSGTRAETKELNDQVAALLPKNEQARIASQRLNEFRAAFTSRQAEFDDLRALLPEQRELTSVLQSVQDRARLSRLTLRRFTPKDDFQQDFYSGKPIEVEVTSTFANLRAFFEQMARYQRIVSITDFKLKQLEEKDQRPGQTLDAQFMMSAYYVSAEKLAAPPPAAAPPAGAPPAAAPAAPAPAK
ncbi:MAG TPA: type 4a pilus biogenesis protein PilO [Pyrinomonadaceae bacterium]|jgi:Tfp pilus assembly protein PilO|nr:type 4a pilus biogenesis protein PilO [Pyrinomonadaceae bacterium]